MTYYEDMEEQEDVSQFGEYTFLKKYFEKHPPKYKCLVDAGANGVKLSNSYNFLHNYAWKGLLIEPNKSNFDELEIVYRTQPNTILVNAAVADFDGSAKFYLHEVKGHHSLRHKTDRFVIVDTFRLQTLLQLNFIPLDFDYLTIDVEGMDQVVVEDMLKNSGYRPTIILHEKDVGRKFKGNILEKFKYEIIHETRGNFIYKRRGK